MPGITFAIAAVTLAALARAEDAPTPQHVTFPAECPAFAKVAVHYFDQHGIFARQNRGMATSDGVPFDDYSLFGGASHNFPGVKPWTNSRGDRIGDLQVYWHYANRSDTEKVPFGVWRLRLEHYRLRGEMKLFSNGNGCDVDLRVHFETGGGNVIGVLPVDAQWDYGSNGRLEREYIDGISAELTRQK
jgi:hypothetical protein